MSSMKKPKLQSAFPDNLPPTFLSEVIGEVDNEIALKQQLTETLEARIAWALMLKNYLKEQYPTSDGNSSSEYTFRNDALDALSLGEQNSECILQGEPTPPRTSDHNRTVRAAPRNQSYPITSFKPKPSFLYTRSNPLVIGDTLASLENCTYILKCPECSRTAFTSLQGLLNHARLAHNLEWGTHDNCIRSCAVLDNDLDVEYGIEVSGAPVGIPALRDLFQRAVGTSTQDVGMGKEQSGLPPSDGPRTLEEKISAEGHLVKTLGFHGDSPALAPFLGKESTRREIKVWDEDMDVDVFGNKGNMHRDKKCWKMPFTPRNFVENSTVASSLDVSKSEQPTIVNQNQDKGPMGQVAENVASDQSRFHFIARIVITDRSLWIPLERRTQISQKYTHKWMISVDAPAYTHHITSVLNSVKVSSSDSIVDPPSTGSASGPPFVVIGFTNRPFLAKVELSFTGTSSFQNESALSEQKVSFEHWVNLDLAEHRDPYDGEDQVLDVELDKNTVLKPPHLEYTPIRSKSLWNQVTLASILDYRAGFPKIDDAGTESKEDEIKEIKQEESTQEVKKEEDVEQNMLECNMEEPLKTEEQINDHRTRAISELPPEDLSILNRCVMRFPMIFHGERESGPEASAIPYRPPPSREYLDNLILGRKKSIEWGRALAIRNAYTKQMQKIKGQNFIPLTVPAIYLWMTDNEHFLRGTKTVKQEAIVERAESDVPAFQWCAICGLEADLHKTTHPVKMEPLDHKDDDEAKGSVTESYRGNATLMSDQECYIVPSVLQITRLPRIDLSGLSSHNDSPAIPQTKNYTVKGGSLVATADPTLVLSVQKLMEGLMLPKYVPLVNRRDISVGYPIDIVGEHRMDVEDMLSTPALLAHFTKQFLHVLIEDGLEVAERDRILASGMLSSTSRKGNRRVVRTRLKTSQLLTPTHILSGILMRGRGSSCSGMDTVVLSSLSNLGMTVEYNDQLTPSRQGEGNSRVKVED